MVTSEDAKLGFSLSIGICWKYLVSMEKNPLDRYVIRWKSRVKIYAFGSSFLLLVLWRSGEITQLIKVFLYKHKDPTSIPRTYIKKMGVTVYSCHSMARR